MTQPSLQAGEVYALQEKETGKWFAFQIIQIGEEDAVYVDLDYWSDIMPGYGKKSPQNYHALLILNK